MFIFGLVYLRTRVYTVSGICFLLCKGFYLSFLLVAFTFTFNFRFTLNSFRKRKWAVLFSFTSS